MGGVYGPLLASHACTKLGSKAWEFVTPLLLLQFSDGTLIAPTVFGLAIFGFKFAFGPAAGRWMDHTERMRVIRYGIALQAVGVVSALGVLGLLVLQRNSSSSDALTAALGGGGIAGVVLAVLTALGALVALAVKAPPARAVEAAADERGKDAEGDGSVVRQRGEADGACGGGRR